MDVATISAWFCTSSTLPPDIQKHLLHQHLKLEIIKQTVKFEPRFCPEFYGQLCNLTQEKNDGKLKSFLVFATVVAEVLKNNLELDRTDLEAEYFFESTEDNFRLELDDIYNKLMKGLSSADDKAIADILDTRFFCKILFSLKENSFVSDDEKLKINVKKIFESDIEEHPEILNDFVELSEKFPNFSFDRVQTFDPSIFHAFKIKRKMIPKSTLTF